MATELRIRLSPIVEHLNLMPALPSRITGQAMIDTNPQATKHTSRSISSPGSENRRESMQNSSRASQKSMSPTGLSVKSSDSPRHRATPAARSNSSPASVHGSGRLSPSGILRPLEIQSPNSINLQLPPTCGAKQLAKLKRFLHTLQQFGSDISVDIGDRVKALVLALVNSQISIEDFHSKLQETTNFPLKPFVIPFLKATLPALQRELLHCAQISRQSPQQYLANNERIIFDTSVITENIPNSKSSSISPEFREDVVKSSKRKTLSNSIDSSEAPPQKVLLRDNASPGNRRSSRSPPHTVLMKEETGLLTTAERRHLTEHDLLTSPSQIKLDDISRMFRARLEDVRFSGVSGSVPHRYESVVTNKDTPPAALAKSPDQRREDHSWKHIETVSNQQQEKDEVLSDVANMVVKAKSALSSLQESRVKETQEFSLWMRRHAEGIDQDFKKRTGEIMSQTMKHSEDKIAEIKRQSDEMVSEVKRRAIIEINQAVCAAENRANEKVNQEIARLENVLAHIKKTAKDEATRAVNKQAESPENCWNCGRRASETCSGCNKARYCGQFCQHKDWDRHHTSCGGNKDKATDKKTTTPIKMVETKQEKTL